MNQSVITFLSAFRTTVWECYEYREVLYNILSRDLKVKYKRTYFGYLWSLLNPLLQLAVLGAVFSHIVQRAVHDYTLYLFSGLLAWNFFQSSTLLCSKSLLENENFIKKIYLPKMIFPLSKIALRGIDFVFSVLALTLLGLVFGFPIRATFALVPAAMVPLFAFTLGIGLIVAVLTVYFRDTEYLLGVFMQLLYFATPIMYWEGLLPEKFRFVLSLNPFMSQIRLFHRLIYEGVMPTSSEWGLALGIAGITLIVGLGLLKTLEEDLVFRL
jgi:ABC-type polysaccharide/polyol phosphate export permease